MKFFLVLSVCASFFLGGADAFVARPAIHRRQQTGLSMKNNFDADAYARSMSAAAIDQMKNLKPEDLEKMIAELDNMGGMQKAALKAMNMDPEMMKKSLQMMKENPAMIANAQKVMENMTPDEMLEQSRKAQEQLKKMSPDQLDAMNVAIKDIPAEQLSAAADLLKQQKSAASGVIDAEVDDEEEEKAMYTGPGSSSDSKVIDVMFQVAEFMSDPPTDRGVTFAGFSSLPIVQLLSGDREFDLSPAELKECWATGSLGATRLDRNGFERVWKEVQEYFEEDVMTEARKEAKKRSSPKKRRGSAKTTTTIGENLKPNELTAVNEKMKNLSNDEVGSVLDMMEKMDPAQEARLKAMGVDPLIMQETAKLLKENPQLREQAKKMMENMSPEDMLKASQQAQEQMKGMSKADIERTVAELKNKK
ncbi:hypothetical protein IV203_029126 [Nitzschia inconspicua]|uniref:STI1 domain-containing protein n=1 Tax=Nitzschia inconspicua TaxID=303405 RepID=A0A9K3LSX4_9STRA|nr:hypothetical protein IV203_029126 [Nitzschia inconspicua]